MISMGFDPEMIFLCDYLFLIYSSAKYPFYNCQMKRSRIKSPIFTILLYLSHTNETDARLTADQAKRLHYPPTAKIGRFWSRS